MEQKATNITWHERAITKEDREKANGHKGVIVWFTGLSGSGKSTVAVEVEKKLHELGARCYLLDGDNVRYGLNKNLGFSPEDRTENVRRVGEVAKLFADAGIIVLASFISPCRADRDQVRAIVKQGEFVEVAVTADIETCKQRDPKGLYKLAIQGKIKEFTGISAPYEEPLNPEITVDTSKLSVDKSAQVILDYLKNNGITKV